MENEEVQDDAIQQDEDGLFPVALSPNVTVRMKKLNGVEARRADTLAEKPEESNRCRALCAVREVRTADRVDKFDLPRNTGDLDRVAGRLDVNEYDMLTLKYVELFVSSELEAQAKKLADRR